jgi:hypothetical protein
MASDTGTDGRVSGTGQDTPKVCVHVPPRFPLRPTGHAGTLSRPVPLSRLGILGGRRCLPALPALDVLNRYGRPDERPPSRNEGARDRLDEREPPPMTVAHPGRKRLPNRREHALVNLATCDGFKYTAGLGYFDDGSLAKALQHGVPLEKIRHALTGNGNGEASSLLGTLLDLLACGREP